jgi:O-antigen/teichoic acid export membrane protein
MLGSLFFMVSPAVASSLFAEGAHAEEGLWHKARSSMLIISALLAPSMLFFLLAGHYVMAVFGPAYPQHGGTLLLLLIISAVPDAITNVYVSVLRVRRRLGDAAVLNLGMAALTLALAWVLLPSMGIAGAGAAWLIAQTAGSVGVAAHIWLTVQRRPAMPPASARDQARTEQTELAPALPSARKDGV